MSLIMVRFIKVSGVRKVLDTVEAYNFGKTEQSLRETGLRTWLTEKDA
jgi:hypothetical protein